MILTNLTFNHNRPMLLTIVEKWKMEAIQQYKWVDVNHIEEAIKLAKIECILIYRPEFLREEQEQIIIKIFDKIFEIIITHE
jgi:hypothetical protein